MKIIKASVDLEKWCFETKCQKCYSDLGIEAPDLRHKWSKEGSYYFTCQLCNTRQIMRDGDIPAIIKADTEKHRADPVVYID